MGLTEEILAWAAARPWWQQAVLARLAAGETFGAAEYRSLAQAMLEEPPKPPKGGWLGAGLGLPVEANEQVCLLSVRDTTNVNALAPEQSLTFSPTGITVVYGNNASGKSGYARVIKQQVRTRHRDAILTNVFETVSTNPRAVLAYSLDGQEREVAWPGDAPGPLAQISFYDESCGDSYVSAESDVTYRPAALSLLDQLIRVCDGVRRALDDLLKENTGSTVTLPAVPAGTSAATFLQHLSATTTMEALDAACAPTEDADDQETRLAAEEARLHASDPTREKYRLIRLATSLDTVAAALNRSNDLAGDAAEGTLRATRDRAVQLRAAADVASSATFDSEPVRGVGSQTWRALWEAARRFSEIEAFPGQEFPVTTDGAHCPLCQQQLGAQAATRLNQFHAFMTDDTQRQAQVAEQGWHDALLTLTSTQLVTPDTAVHLENITEPFGPLATTARQALSTLDQRRAAILTWDDEQPQVMAAPPDMTVVTALATHAEHLRQDAEKINSGQFSGRLRAVTTARAELQARRTLARQRGTIEQEITRRKARAQLEAARTQTDTTGITHKATSLARSHVTSLILDRYTRESDRLGVERVTLQDAGGRKGQLRQRPALLGAAVKAPLPRVLSEGEQTALGLAGFFTEVYFDRTRSALIFDDPVTSLDHERRARAAKRLAEFAKDRQVIVFTHDVIFVGDLRKACEETEVEFTERAVERRRDGTPGVTLNQHPWKAKDVAGRLDTLQRQLACIKREEQDWDQATYEKETQDWAGGLSETWERIISMEIVNQVVDRGTLEVRPKMFRLLARITEEDNKELQQSYGRCSAWAKRHDKDPSINYTAPTVQQMEGELALVKNWFDRVRRYRC